MNGPISDQAYQEDNGACNSWLPQTTTTMDFSTATIPIDEGSNHATERQAPWGVNGVAELSMTGLCTNPSARPNEEASSPNLRPAILASRGVALTSPIASSQFAPADETHRKFWCRVCGVGFVQRQGLNRHKKGKTWPTKHLPPVQDLRVVSGTKLFVRQASSGTTRKPGRDNVAMGAPSDLRRCSPHTLLATPT